MTIWTHFALFLAALDTLDCYEEEKNHMHKGFINYLNIYFYYYYPVALNTW